MVISALTVGGLRAMHGSMCHDAQPFSLSFELFAAIVKFWVMDIALVALC